MKLPFRLAATAAAVLAGTALAMNAAAEEPHDSSHPPHAATPHAPPPRGPAPHAPAPHGPAPQPQPSHGPTPPGHGPMVTGHAPMAMGHGPVAGDARFDRRSNPQQWQSARSGWHGAHPIQNVPWRGNRDWWRSRPEFHGYQGPRAGFWFAPGFGYLTLPGAYRGHHWGVGEYIPALFWEYRVANWAAYSLDPPPYGCAWIWIDGGVALIDLSDGYVMDVEYDVY